jgi:hypothetical protein
MRPRETKKEAEYQLFRQQDQLLSVQMFRLSYEFRNQAKGKH